MHVITSHDALHHNVENAILVLARKDVQDFRF